MDKKEFDFKNVCFQCKSVKQFKEVLTLLKRVGMGWRRYFPSHPSILIEPDKHFEWWYDKKEHTCIGIDEEVVIYHLSYCKKNNETAYDAQVLINLFTDYVTELKKNDEKEYMCSAGFRDFIARAAKDGDFDSSNRSVVEKMDQPKLDRIDVWTAYFNCKTPSQFRTVVWILKQLNTKWQDSLSAGHMIKVDTCDYIARFKENGHYTCITAYENAIIKHLDTVERNGGSVYDAQDLIDLYGYYVKYLTSKGAGEAVCRNGFSYFTTKFYFARDNDGRINDPNIDTVAVEPSPFSVQKIKDITSQFADLFIGKDITTPKPTNESKTVCIDVSTYSDESQKRSVIAYGKLLGVFNDFREKHELTPEHGYYYYFYADAHRQNVRISNFPKADMSSSFLFFNSRKQVLDFWQAHHTLIDDYFMINKNKKQ